MYVCTLHRSQAWPVRVDVHDSRVLLLLLLRLMLLLSWKPSRDPVSDRVSDIPELIGLGVWDKAIVT